MDKRNRRAGGFIFGGKKLWVILILVAIAGTAIVLVASMKKASSEISNKGLNTFTVRKDDLTITVTESGNIKAQESTDIFCEVEGRGIEVAELVPEGTVITEEDVKNKKVLCQLNASDLQDTLSQEKITFSTAKASYIEAEEAYEIQKKQNESDIATARLAVQFGLMDLQKHLGKAAAKKLIEDTEKDPNSLIDITSLLEYLDNSDGEKGGAKQKLNELTDTILLAEGKLTKAQQELASSVKLRDANYAPEIEVKEKQLAVQSFDIQHKQAVDTLDLYKRYDFPKETEKFLSDYEEAKRELERTYARTRSLLAQAKAKLENAEATFALQTEQVAKLERQIAACTILAPSPGIVVYGTSADWHRRREDPIEVGDMVHQGQKIFTIPNSNVMGVQLSVHESSVDKVKPGQYATITVEAFPDQTFSGKVIKVAPLPDPQHGWLSAGVRVYSTNVEIDGAYDYIRPGMSAKVEILIEELKDVMIVPIQVVANRAGRKVCYISTPQGPKEREVKTGAFNDTFVQILEGLQVGEEVLLTPPRIVESDEDKSKQRPKGPQAGGPREGSGTTQGGRPRQDGGAQQGGGPRQGSGPGQGGGPRQGGGPSQGGRSSQRGTEPRGSG
ncbi:MAG: HlyD family efflux transporter periplasmic adaptor subunit [Phycisphaerae bacterium]|nr:HlyD family efflux transporter periplasmic adaptor subunit [Phycisphaerae bacterium]NIP53849.1 HlyD family efflux transporter periplasmic adaptor subunit [Phycisphaerae bacterium]NIS52798.1 HlyD family efflux transporter periplasmic adaptor subunit [Phycisphaerae bacterium]NIU10210.1 HlyD family efflux transporter periplasmic adaptor subunit [Phycisphaerae bacterium]NIU57968.1 HlyD family efflux transporter periplasmic adaptor subunit [Phycisphaerae bacterium]